MSSNGLVEQQTDPDVIEITNRVQSYTEPETTGELYDFGKMLLMEGVDRGPLDRR